jgi:hypothetical protein
MTGQQPYRCFNRTIEVLFNKRFYDQEFTIGYLRINPYKEFNHESFMGLHGGNTELKIDFNVVSARLLQLFSERLIHTQMS